MGGDPFITKAMVHKGREEGWDRRMADLFEDYILGLGRGKLEFRALFFETMKNEYPVAREEATKRRTEALLCLWSSRQGID